MDTDSESDDSIYEVEEGTSNNGSGHASKARRIMSLIASMTAFFIGLLTLRDRQRVKRRAPFVRTNGSNRVEWDKHMQKLIFEGEFVKVYKMPYESFCKLSVWLTPYVLIDSHFSRL